MDCWVVFTINPLGGTAFGTLAVQSTVSLAGRFVIVVLITPTKRDSILYILLEPFLNPFNPLASLVHLLTCGTWAVVKGSCGLVGKTNHQPYIGGEEGSRYPRSVPQSTYREDLHPRLD
jgi:hypothetical protein